MKKLLIVGYGRMGRLVDTLAPDFGFEVTDRLDELDNLRGAGIDAGRGRGSDVAIDFSTADAVPVNLPKLIALGLDVVVGTTGWYDEDGRLREAALASGVGVVVAPNFSTGAALFEAIVERAASLFADQGSFGAWIHELHHVAKRDAPSGTALALERALARGGYARRVDIASTRAGSMPGTHVVGFDAPAETVTLTHTTRDRSTFARGALAAAQWVGGRRGWFTFRDVLGLSGS